MSAEKSTVTAKPVAKLTAEEEELLKASSRNVSTKSSALLYANAIIASVIPIWVFWRINQMEPLDFYIYYLVATAVSTYLLTFAYKNVKFVMKHKIAQKRDESISKELSAKFADKKNKKEKDDKILTVKNEVADYEATTFSIFYNNSLFLMLLLIASFFVFKNFTPVFNYLLSIGTAAGIVALFSTGTK